MSGSELPVSLGDPSLLKLCGLKAHRALMQARQRSGNRIRAGSTEEPFPEPATETGGARLYWPSEVIAWHEKHTVQNNPMRSS